MENKFAKKKGFQNTKRISILIFILLHLLACSLFSPSWEEGIEHKKKGEAYLNEGKYNDAIEEFSKAIEIIEDHNLRTDKNIGDIWGEAYKLRGNAYFNLKDYDKSLNDYNKSIEVHSRGFGSAYVERGNVYLVKKDYEKALADFEKATPFYQNDYRATLGMGIAYFETEKYEKADQFLFSALNDLSQSKDQPNYDPDDHIKAYEYSIKVSQQKGDTKNTEQYKESLEELKKQHNKN